ncbi:IclR family transcriptional regulator C-terminal domain-containing protein [Sphingobium sp. HBC34]|uniref:IclR family transcriptional regulator C-terminal domain-containing protein n=1 Tax=Sphingobium cyanobacteriorum TaxID=3063954 RepID=A0ABT8ZRG9_9SPHN|nr:IclR family transcriptional regulator C-terminal domain-containing protein [Sphingobium sp. HBC34]MDO7836796.1 IclR family transcriptional regulator C-terminal domain-containing protein [Sphingobium sp. HBC34]
MNGSTPSTVKSAMRTIDILEYVVARPAGVVAQEIAAGLAIPVSSLSYLLATLVERDYLARDGRRYLPGGALERLASPRVGLSLADKVRPLVKSLRLQLNETASFFIRDGWQLEAIVTETAEQSLRYSISVGTRSPLHCLAAGKALLAALPDTELDRYFNDTTLPAFTPGSITDTARLRAELAEVRATGVGRTREEYTPGICGLGMAALVQGVAIGAFAVAIPVPRFTAEVERRTIAKLEQAVSLFTAAEMPAV